jgi:hypothetical protein
VVASLKTSNKKIGAGKHHRVAIKLSEPGPDGTLDFFSDRFSLHIGLNKGKISGSAIVAEEGFSAKLKLSPRNLWDLLYTHEGKSGTMSISARLGRITKRTSIFDVSRKSKNHDIKLGFSKKLGINGHVRTKLRYLDFGLSFSKDGATSVDIKNSGKSYSLALKFFPDGMYEFNAKIDMKGGKLTLAKKKKSIKAEASFSF